jgi:hypothetical protein
MSKDAFILPSTEGIVVIRKGDKEGSSTPQTAKVSPTRKQGEINGE